MTATDAERNTMDHQEQHHQHHQKEREHEKKELRAHAQGSGHRNTLPFHPAWLVAVGIVLILAAVAIWTFYRPW
jgi:hypothetical protein